MDYLPNHPEIKLLQRKDMFRLNTDTALLGEFFEFFDGETLLDIGTNNGALLLYTLLKGKGNLIGIDILEEALVLAKYNLKLNNLDATLIKIDAKYLNIDKVDVVVANPPFFKIGKSTPCENEYLKIAKNDLFLSLEDLFLCVKRNLKKGGRFYLVHRFLDKDYILDLAKKHQFILKEEKDIFDNRVNKYVQVLFYFTF